MKTTEINEHQKQALDFATKHNIVLEVLGKERKLYFDDDKAPRDVYKLRLERKDKSYIFEFGQSVVNSERFKICKNGEVVPDFRLNNGNIFASEKTAKDFIKNVTSAPKDHSVKYIKGEAPNMYDVLACLTKYEVTTFEDFCADYGYDIDSRKAEKTFKAVKNEWENVERLFGDIIEELQEIQ